MHKEMLEKACVEAADDWPQLPPAAEAGARLEAVDTPSLLLELDAFEENLRTMQALVERHDVGLRAHAKAHKCPEVARRQVALGAVGICCQKVSEAFPFARAGIHDILISNEVIGPAKVAMAAELARRTRLSVCIDSLAGARALSDALVAVDARATVLVEVDVGHHRCGIAQPAEAVALAQAAQALPMLSFGGIQAYHGTLQHKRSSEQRRQACDQVAARVRRFLAAFQAAGLPCPVVSGGGTGTAAFDAASGVFTEIQAGSYAFMDVDYAANDWAQTPTFKHSLFVLATVISTPTPDRAVLDAGLKSLSAESGLPRLHDTPGWRCIGISDEHTVLSREPDGAPLELGSKVRLVPSHVDPTFNLHDQLVVVRHGQVHALWPVAARGLSR